MNTRMLSTFYFAVGVVFIALETIEATWPSVISKALIIPILFILYYRLVKEQINTFHRLIMVGLFFSWIGDVTLQLQQFNENLFLLGLSGFLVTQVMYLIAFFSTKGNNILFFRKAYLIVPVIIYGIILMYFLYGGLGDMRIPVIIYAVVILTMLTAAINRKNKVSRPSYVLVLTGAILFVLSDSLIALNKFGYPFILARVAIMSTYVTAQYLIIMGCIQQYGLARQRSNDPGIQRSNDPGIQRSNDPGIQRSNDPGIQRSNDPGIQRSNDPGIQRSNDSVIQ